MTLAMDWKITLDFNELAGGFEGISRESTTFPLESTIEGAPEEEAEECFGAGTTSVISTIFVDFLLLAFFSKG